MTKINLIRRNVDRRQQVFDNIKKRKVQEHKMKEEKAQKTRDQNDAYKRAMDVV